LIDTSIGKAMFLDADHTSIHVGTNGMVALLAYPGSNPLWDLLRSADAEDDDDWPRREADVPAVLA
jgi:hypothetical protein